MILLHVWDCFKSLIEGKWHIWLRPKESENLNSGSSHGAEASPSRLVVHVLGQVNNFSHDEEVVQTQQ